MKHEDKIAAIRTVLLESWDPVGVNDVPAAQDEYDSYLPSILQLLERHVSVADLARHLTDITARDMGLVAVAQRDLAVAERLLRLRLR